MYQLNRRFLVIAPIICAVALGAWFGIKNISQGRHQVVGSSSEGTKQVENQISHSSDNETKKLKGLIPPDNISEWNSWDDEKKQAFVTFCEHNRELTPEVISFFKQEVRNKSLGVVTRNNMANCLVGQEKSDGELAPVFEEMLLDETDNQQWRDYSLQFLAMSLPWSSDPSRYAETLWNQALSGKGTLSGTALLHLSYLSEQGVSPLPAEYNARIIECVKDSRIEISTRMTAISIVGREKIFEAADEVRKVAQLAPEPAVKRAAIAALGELSQANDLALVRSHVEDPDPLIAAAAKSAEQKISKNKK